MVVQRSKWCDTCKQRTIQERQGANHLFHLHMTVVTAVLWLLFWNVVSITGRFTGTTTPAHEREGFAFVFVVTTGSWILVWLFMSLGLSHGTSFRLDSGWCCRKCMG